MLLSQLNLARLRNGSLLIAMLALALTGQPAARPASLLKTSPQDQDDVALAPIGKTVVEAETSQAVARNPVFTFRIKGGAPGDKIEVSWLDTQGDSNRTEAAVA